MAAISSYCSKPGKGRCGAAFEDDRALAFCYIAGGREGRSRFVLVVVAERQQAFATQAIDFRQIESDTGFVDSSDRAVEMSEAIRRPAGCQQHVGRQAELILWQRTEGRSVADFGVKQSRSIGNASADRSRPGRDQQAARAPLR